MSLSGTVSNSYAAANHLKTHQKTKTWTILGEITRWTQSKGHNRFLLVQLHDQKKKMKTNVIKCNALFMMLYSTHTFFLYGRKVGQN